MGPRGQRKPASEALAGLGSAFSGVGLFSGFISILMLTGSIYMLQVYDRVLASRSIPTLIGISLIVLAAFVVQGVLDAMRARMLARIGAQFDHTLSPQVFELMRLLPLRGARSDQAMQGVRDLDGVRTFLGGMGPTAFFDMPFMPIFFIGCFLLHPWVGVLAFLGGVIIFGLTLWTERRTKDGTQQITRLGSQRLTLAEASRRNAEALQAMGMGGTFKARWKEVNDTFVTKNLEISDSVNGIGAAAKVFRMAFQSAVLGLGAYLVIQQQMSPGAMIAASILTSRALAPIETAVAHWRGFVGARQSFHRLDDLLAAGAAQERVRTALPEPHVEFVADDLAIAIPGRNVPILAGAGLRLKSGEGLLLIGQSGSGKSTLIRALAGVWPVLRGSVRLDGATLDQWDPQQLGQHIGYMPQDVELFEGSIAENIARFQPDVPDADVIAAAQAAGAHDLIVKFPEGYGTRIGEAGMTLSGGQRQRVGLARALFRNPFLLLLDEPNSNLDVEGENALIVALAGARERGAIVVVVSHKTALIPVVDFVGHVHEGRLQIITREEYRQNMLKAAQAAQEAQQGRAPGMQTWGTQAPGTQAPGTQAPGTQVPGAQAAGTQAPKTQSPTQGSGIQVQGSPFGGRPSYGMRPIPGLQPSALTSAPIMLKKEDDQ
jgi:ATP-binding cassette, subfamily C, bacterial PrsD